MTRRLTITWPDRRAFRGRPERPIRLLAVSDDPDPALDHRDNRDALGPVDLVVGCGDLEPAYLAFVADAFVAPLVYVRGNHDSGGAWKRSSTTMLPEPLADSVICRDAGLCVAGLSWPGEKDEGRPDELAAWGQVVRLALRTARPFQEPLLVLSHAPPRGAGDVPTDPFHAGYDAYRWLAQRLRPPLWLHGHTPFTGTEPWRCSAGATTFANVTGSVLVELQPPGSGERASGEVEIERRVV
ncbi:MAG: metallophosphoesterase [Chloroflexota bacterium]|nr:metallophosphoesterase [Chloroflexota bacterium]